MRKTRWQLTTLPSASAQSCSALHRPPRLTPPSTFANTSKFCDTSLRYGSMTMVPVNQVCWKFCVLDYIYTHKHTLKYVYSCVCVSFFLLTRVFDIKPSLNCLLPWILCSVSEHLLNIPLSAFYYKSFFYLRCCGLFRVDKIHLWCAYLCNVLTFSMFHISL